MKQIMNLAMAQHCKRALRLANARPRNIEAPRPAVSQISKLRAKLGSHAACCNGRGKRGVNRTEQRRWPPCE